MASKMSFGVASLTRACIVITFRKSSYKCDSCKKLTWDNAYENSLAKNNQKGGISTETDCTVSRIGDKDSLSVHLEAVYFNDICTMKTVNSLVIMVSKLSSEEQQLRNLEDRDLLQAPSHVPSLWREIASSASPNNATAK
jgi:hypothetical protein